LPRPIEIAQSQKGGYTRTMKKSTLFGMIIALALLAACSLSPEVELASRSLELADLTLINAHYVLKDKGQTPLFIEAGQIEIYEKSHKAHLAKVAFSRSDEEGSVTLMGVADRVEANTESWDANLSGNIVVHDLANNLTIHAQTLTWLHDEELLFSPPEDLVLLIYEDDKRVEGYGLEAHLAEAIFTFDRLIRGEIGQ
jgi:LPS export ABC transporter protein LptC